MPINSLPSMPSSSSKLKKKKKKKKFELDTNTSSSSKGSDSWKKLKILEGEDSCGGDLIIGGGAARDLLLDGDGDYDVPAVSVEEECQVIEIRLPVDRFQMNKKLWEEKEILLVKRGLSTQLQVPTSTDIEDLATQLERVVKALRILHLDENELYFVEDDDDGPFGTINELESLYTIWSLIECLKSDSKPEGEKVLQFLQELTSDKINALCPEYPDKETFKEEAEDGMELLKWGKDSGMTADKITITRCSETGKGVEASEDIEIGEIVLKVPDFLIIDENAVQRSEMYKTLMGKDISSEEMLLLWCMMERRNPGPKFKVYFKLLPPKFCTGLSFGKNAVREIQATRLGWELQEILEHLSERFQKLCSNGIIPTGYDFEEYMWARQLLDTNGMRIFASDGTSRLCLVPVAGFFNHSVRDMLQKSSVKDALRKALEELLCFLWDFGDGHQDVWRCDDDDDDDESDSFELPLIWHSDGTCDIDADNEIMTKPYHRKREYEWDVKLARGYKYRMRSLAVSCIKACENTLKENL